MVRRAVNTVSPIAALAIVWISLQSFVFDGEMNPASAALLVPPSSIVAPDLLPELGSVSQLLATTSTRTLGESVPDSVKRLLVANGAVLLVPNEPGGGS